ncbi:PaaI family thioesterase [Gordonia sp. HY002]|uniref:PaaI family thioesterase n=1 Tax=Gordonia zhenghanii TaxID=2911516 RepID=UPI001EF05393|nr:PaaI family thioesterase [Gordonia zhenghanii]MCF8570148.1 PaaI family thioesterase [Gordonia zhenghanii]MCF8606719.1 PaaI family thioesterase [Gordonia zhenghanii]
MSRNPADPFLAFAVGRDEGFDGAVMHQCLGTSVTDHRGLIELPALAVLFDDLGGYRFYFQDPSTSSLQSRLTMSMLARPSIDERLQATADLRMSSHEYGTTSVEVTGADGRVLCSGLARNVRVGRAQSTDSVSGVPVPQAPNDVPAVDGPPADATGRDVIDQIRRGAPIGPIAELLGGSISAVDDDALTFTTETAPWMGNMMGTMHGGVIGAVVAQGCSFGAQLHTRAGQQYQIVDFTVAFLRSPAVDGRRIHTHVTPVKLGRRLSVFDADLRDDDGTLLAHATADVRFDV